MPDATMTLQFRGDAVDAGAMNVRQLAPVLIATADVMRDAHFLLGMPGQSPRVELRTTASGSFIVQLLVTNSDALGQQATSLLMSPPVIATANLSALVGAVVATIRYVKKLGGRMVTQTQQIASGQVRVELADGSGIEMPGELVLLVTDPGYRRSLRGMVEPLGGNRGVNSLTVSADGQSETIVPEDYPSFATTSLAKDGVRRTFDPLHMEHHVEDETVHVSQPQPSAYKEDGGDMIDDDYQRQLELLQKIRDDLTDVATSRNQMEVEMNELQTSIKKLDRQARDSVKAGREDLAREALARRSAAEGQVSKLEAHYQSIQKAEERLTFASQQLQEQIDDLRTQKEVTKAIEAADQAEARVAATKARVAGEKARVRATDQLWASGALDAASSLRDDIQDELDRMAVGGIDAELDKIKKELSPEKQAIHSASPKPDLSQDPSTQAVRASKTDGDR
jgi:phage shock protein A